MTDPDRTLYPKLVCHRGGALHGPENSRESAEMCFAKGYDFVELDLRTTRDDQIVVIHDSDVSRVLDGEGNVADMLLDDLKSLRYRDAGGDAATIPTLDEILATARGRGGFMIELKSADPDRVVDIAKEHGLAERSFFWSFDLWVLRWLRRNHPGVRVMGRTCDYGSIDEALADYRPDVLEFDPDVDDLSAMADPGLGSTQRMYLTKRPTRENIEDIAKFRPDLVNTARPDIIAAKIAEGWS